MGLFNFPKKSKQQDIDLNEAPKSNSAPIKINKQKMKDFMVKAVGEILSQSNERTNFTRPEYNL